MNSEKTYNLNMDSVLLLYAAFRGYEQIGPLVSFLNDKDQFKNLFPDINDDQIDVLKDLLNDMSRFMK